MRSFVDETRHVLFRIHQAVDAPHVAVGLFHAFFRKTVVFCAAEDEQGAGRNQADEILLLAGFQNAGNIIVDAVAVQEAQVRTIGRLVSHAVDHATVGGGPADGHGDLDAVVQGGEHPGVGAALGEAQAADAARVHVGTGTQVVEHAGLIRRASADDGIALRDVRVHAKVAFLGVDDGDHVAQGRDLVRVEPLGVIGPSGGPGENQHQRQFSRCPSGFEDEAVRDVVRLGFDVDLFARVGRLFVTTDDVNPAGPFFRDAADGHDVVPPYGLALRFPLRARLDRAVVEQGEG